MGDSRALRIVGAGPAGLTAAIVAARAGRRVIVSERSSRVAHRFHGDYQGLENWTAPEDVLEEIAALGIEPSFKIAPFREQVCYGPDGREHRFHSASRPFYYLVRRGPDPGTLDHALAQQALAAGAEIRFNETVRHPDQGDVVAWGPRRAYILAVGYLFTTDLADGSFAVLDDRLAPKGYGYLLIHRGRATLATCLFSDFHREAQYLERVLDFFQRRLGFTMREPQRFGGVGYSGAGPAPLGGLRLHRRHPAGPGRASLLRRGSRGSPGRPLGLRHPLRHPLRKPGRRLHRQRGPPRIHPSMGRENRSAATRELRQPAGFPSRRRARLSPAPALDRGGEKPRRPPAPSVCPCLVEERGVPPGLSGLPWRGAAGAGRMRLFLVCGAGGGGGGRPCLKPRAPYLSSAILP